MKKIINYKYIENLLDLCTLTMSNLKMNKKPVSPWLMWLSELSGSLRTKRSPFGFLVGAHAWVAGQVPVGGMREAANQCFSYTLMFVSLSLSLLPFPLSEI